MLRASLNEKLARLLRPKPFPPGEQLVSLGMYGDEFIMLIEGTLLVKDACTGYDGQQVDGKPPGGIVVTSTDHTPFIGLAACLGDEQLTRVKQRTDQWAVDSDSYCDTLWVRRLAF